MATTNDDLTAAASGPAIPAAPGWQLLDQSNPQAPGQPVIAWRLGANCTLAVTAIGCTPGNHYCFGPDGQVHRHFVSSDPSEPLAVDLDAWKASHAS
jgi:hypothetical protein